MGRWSYSNRLTVESCKSITTSFLNKHKYFDRAARHGVVTWRRNGEVTGSIDIEVSIVKDDEYIRFEYTSTDRYTGEKDNLDYKARLESTPCYFGGRRWWFICPLVTDEGACNRRVGALYLPGTLYFGCRHCYDLTYKSCKENHQFDNFYKSRGIDPKTVRHLFKHKK